MNKTFLKHFTSSILSVIFLISIIGAAALAATSFAVLEIPVFINVVANEGAFPGNAEFELDITGYPEDTNFTVVENSVKTSGAGEFEGTLKIALATENDFWNLSEGFVVQLKEYNEAGWTVDDTQWYVEPYMVTEPDDEGTVSSNIYMAFYNKSEGEEIDYENHFSSYAGVIFNNEYIEEINPSGNGSEEPSAVNAEIKIPYAVNVASKSGTAPEEDFSVEIEGIESSVLKDCDIDGLSVSTDGEGIYRNIVLIIPKTEEALRNVMNGFYISQINEGAKGWEYDKTQWHITPETDDEGKYIVYVRDYAEETESSESPSYNEMLFENVYTADETDPATEPLNKDDDDSDAEVKGGTGEDSENVTLTYVLNGGFAYDTVETYAKDTNVKLTKAASRDGFTFIGWYSDEEAKTKISSITMDESKAVYAGWKKTSVPGMLDGTEHNAYVIGYEDGTVRPANNITRAEVTMIFYRLLNSEIRDANKTLVNNFEDVSVDKWYNEAVSTMAKIGILKGRTDTSFAPEAPITRAEYATICARFDETVSEGSSDFTDISGHWAESYINRASVLGWVKGYEDKTFRPDKEITRAEAMTLTNRVLQRIPDDVTDLASGMRTFTDNADATVWYYIPVQEATNNHTYATKSNGHEKWKTLK